MTSDHLFILLIEALHLEDKIDFGKEKYMRLLSTPQGDYKITIKLQPCLFSRNKLNV